MVSREELFIELSNLNSIFQEFSLSQKAMDLYFEILNRFDKDLIASAIHDFIANESNKHFPKPGELKSLAENYCKQELNDLEYEERRDRDYSEHHKLSPRVKEIIDLSLEIWKINCRLSYKFLDSFEKDDLEKKKLSLKNQIDKLIAERIKNAPAPIDCQSCFNSGWTIIQKTDPFTGLPNQYRKPCDCDLGRKYDQQYSDAIANRRIYTKKKRRGKLEIVKDDRPF